MDLKVKIKFSNYTTKDYSNIPSSICLLGEAYNYFYWGRNEDEFFYITHPINKYSKKITVLQGEKKSRKTIFYKSFDSIESFKVWNNTRGNERLEYQYFIVGTSKNEKFIKINIPNSSRNLFWKYFKFHSIGDITKIIFLNNKLHSKKIGNIEDFYRGENLDKIKNDLDKKKEQLLDYINPERRERRSKFEERKKIIENLTKELEQEKNRRDTEISLLKGEARRSQQLKNEKKDLEGDLEKAIEEKDLYLEMYEDLDEEKNELQKENKRLKDDCFKFKGEIRNLNVALKMSFQNIKKESVIEIFSEFAEVKITDHHGRDKLITWADKLKIFPYIKRIETTQFYPNAKEYIVNMDENSFVFVLYQEDAGFAMKVITTAKNKSENERIIQKIKSEYLKS